MNGEFWILVTGTTLGMLLGLLLVFLVWTAKFRQAVKQWLTQSISVELLTLFQKICWRDYFEAMKRATSGTVVTRPFGTNIHFFRWDLYQFKSSYFSRKPLDDDVPIKTEVMLGPVSKKPLILKTPIMLGGMSYGSSLSFKAKVALAKGASLIGTATNSGSGPFLEETRKLAQKYIIQFARGFWSRSADILNKVDMIEISLGHGAWGPSPVRINGKEVTDGFAQRIKTIPGLDVLIESRLPEVETQADWKALVAHLKDISGGVPIAVKIGGTHYLEQELDLILAGGVDVIVIDGAEGGTHACPTILLDDAGLPTLPSLCRAVKYYKDHQLKGKVSLVIGGGLATPGDFLKCLALGADAVIIGTIPCLVMSHTQVTKATPWEPPTQVIYYAAKKADNYDPELGAKQLANYFASCLDEMKLAARTLGKADLREINKSDLVALDPLYAEIAGIPYYL